MTTRSYNQYCGVAEALDLVGERWTLLVLRDLMPGPQRFSDLARRLPGMGTDLLTSRLRRLVDHGFVEKAPLPTPANGSMYRLTERGRQTQPLISELAKLGGHWLPSPAQSDRRFDAAWALATIAEFLPVAPTTTGVEVTCDGTVQSLQVGADGRCRVEYGHLHGADLAIQGPTMITLGVLIGNVDPSDAAEVTFSGDLDVWVDVIRRVLPESILATN
jgi:DNA-binding HxlR family transcriptional regulator